MAIPVVRRNEGDQALHTPARDVDDTVKAQVSSLSTSSDPLPASTAAQTLQHATNEWIRTQLVSIYFYAQRTDQRVAAIEASLRTLTDILASSPYDGRHSAVAAGLDDGRRPAQSLSPPRAKSQGRVTTSSVTALMQQYGAFRGGDDDNGDDSSRVPASRLRVFQHPHPPSTGDQHPTTWSSLVGRRPNSAPVLDGIGPRHDTSPYMGAVGVPLLQHARAQLAGSAQPRQDYQSLTHPRERGGVHATQQFATLASLGAIFGGGGEGGGAGGASLNGSHNSNHVSNGTGASGGGWLAQTGPTAVHGYPPAPLRQSPPLPFAAHASRVGTLMPAAPPQLDDPVIGGAGAMLQLQAGVKRARST